MAVGDAADRAAAVNAVPDVADAGLDVAVVGPDVADAAPDVTDAAPERTVGDLTLRIDRTLCVGFGDCVTEAPEAFELDDEDIAVFVRPETVERERLLAACRACPVDAITVTDTDGSQLAP